MHHLRRLKAKISHRKGSPVLDGSRSPGIASADGSAQSLSRSVGSGDEEIAKVAESRSKERTHQSPAPPLPSQHSRAGKEGSLEEDRRPVQIDLWQQAFESLSEQQKADLSALVPTRDSTTTQPSPVTASIIPDWIAVTRQRQEECEENFWRVKLGSNEIILRDQTAQIISWLTSAGNIGVQFAPSLVVQIWPVVKGLLKLPVQEAEQMAAILTVADKIARLAVRGAVFETCYTSTNTSPDALGNLHAALLALYSASLGLLATASSLLDSNSVKRTWYTVLHPDSVTTSAGDSLSALEQELALEVQAAESSRSSGMADSILVWLQELEKPIVRIDERVAKILASVDANEEQEILDWISPVLYSSHHDQVTERRLTDTCDWILQHPKYRDWQNLSGSALLWLQGSVGTGKTCLTSKIIDDQKRLLDSGPNDEALAFFYFNRDESSRKSALACLRSLVRQFSTCRSRHGCIQPTLVNLVRTCRRDGRAPSQEICKTQLAHSLNLFPRSTIVLDALDECDEDDRLELVKLLDVFMQGSQRPLKVFISSRANGDIRDAFRDRASVEIGVEDNQDDIAKFINERVSDHRKWAKFSPETKETVVKTLMEKSQAMFRWTDLQIQSLLKLPFEKDVIARLGKLPKDLETAYDEIYTQQMKSRGEVAAGIAERAIMWVLVSLAPLTSDLLLQAVRLDAHLYYDTMPRPSPAPSAASPIYVTEKVDEDDLLDLCANLLTLNPVTDKWTFPHASVSEYFETHHFTRLYAHTYLSSASLALLMDLSQFSQSFDNRKVDAAPDSYSDVLAQSSTSEQEIAAAPDSYSALPAEVVLDGRDGSRMDRNSKIHWSELPASLEVFLFADYAVRFWGQHVALVDEAFGTSFPPRGAAVPPGYLSPEALKTILQAFLGHPNNPSSAYRYWRSRYAGTARFDPDGRVLECYEPSTENFSSLALVHFGIFALLAEWWPKHPVPHDMGSVPDEPCTLPLIDITMRTRHGWTLLHLASYFGHASIVQALILAGMDANEIVGDFESSRSDLSLLSLASESGSVEVCKVLLNYCDVNVPLDSGHPLFLAVCLGRASVVHCLLAAGANSHLDFKVRDTIGFDVVQSIYDEPHYVTAIALAAQRNHVDMLRILVEDSVARSASRVNTRDVLGNAAVFAAFPIRDNPEALRYLILDAKVDPNARYPAQGERTANDDGESAPRRWQTVLCAAAHGIENWDDRYINSLRDLGIVFSLSDDDVKCLQEHFKKTAGMNLLAAAVATHRLSVVRMAVEEWGLDVKSPEYGMHSALIHAVTQWNSSSGKVARYLLEQGADPNGQVADLDGYYNGTRSALIAAVCGDFDQPTLQAVVDTLLQYRADINMQVQYGKWGSALAAAASYYSYDTTAVEVLIAAEADVNQRLEHGEYGSALIHAVAGDLEYRPPCLAEHLLARGADANLVTTHGPFATALMAAAAWGNKQAAWALIDGGADVDHPENHGWEDLLRTRAVEKQQWITLYPPLRRWSRPPPREWKPAEMEVRSKSRDGTDGTRSERGGDRSGEEFGEEASSVEDRGPDAEGFDGETSDQEKFDGDNLNTEGHEIGKGRDDGEKLDEESLTETTLSLRTTDQ